MQEIPMHSTLTNRGQAWPDSHHGRAVTARRVRGRPNGPLKPTDHWSAEVDADMQVFDANKSLDR